MTYNTCISITDTAIEEDTEVLVDESVDVGKDSELIVFNDDHNTFDWVIKCFVEVIGHSEDQAEQLSMIIHFKGKASVKVDTYEKLKPLKQALVDRGLSAVIEEIGEEA